MMGACKIAVKMSDAWPDARLGLSGAVYTIYVVLGQDVRNQRPV